MRISSCHQLRTPVSPFVIITVIANTYPGNCNTKNIAIPFIIGIVTKKQS